MARVVALSEGRAERLDRQAVRGRIIALGGFARTPGRYATRVSRSPSQLPRHFAAGKRGDTRRHDNGTRRACSRAQHSSGQTRCTAWLNQLAADRALARSVRHGPASQIPARRLSCTIVATVSAASSAGLLGGGPPFRKPTNADSSASSGISTLSGRRVIRGSVSLPSCGGLPMMTRWSA